MSKVSIVKGYPQERPENYTSKDLAIVRKMIEEALDNLGGLDKLMGHVNSVMIKPNLVEVPHPSTEGSVLTDPRMVEALVMILKDYGVPHVYVGEGKSVNLKHVQSTTKDAFRNSGLTEVIERAGGEVVGWDEEPFVEIAEPTLKLWDKIRVPKSILDCDYFINLPKLKTHGQTEITVAIKAMQGVYRTDDKIKFHNEAFPWKMLDMLRVAKPNLNIVDGLICGEGFGPIYTEAVPMGLVVASEDPVATDAVCGKIMEIEPWEVPMTRLGWAEGFGEMDLDKIEIVGEPLENCCRHFKRSSIWNPIGMHPHIKIYAGNCCRFTFAQIAACIRRLQLDGLADKLHQDVCIIAGCNAPVPREEYKNIIIVGDDAMDHPYYKEGRGDFIGGNPPLPSIQIKEMIEKYLD